MSETDDKNTMEEGSESTLQKNSSQVVIAPSSEQSALESGALDQSNISISESGGPPDQSIISVSSSATSNNKPIPEHYYKINALEGSLQYEKDRKWLLEKNLPYTFRPKRVDNNNNNNLPPLIKCCLEKDSEQPSFSQNFKAIYDVLTGGDSYPCNECNRQVCQESLWHWLASIVIDISDGVKDMVKSPETSTSGCGAMDAETLKMNTKGTLAELDETVFAEAMDSENGEQTEKSENNDPILQENMDIEIELVENNYDEQLEEAVKGIEQSADSATTVKAEDEEIAIDLVESKANQ